MPNVQRITTKEQAEAYLARYIPKDREFKFPGEVGLARTAYLLKLLGEPQNKLKVIHIAGTSGKGSTAYFMSIILRGLGFNVGLTVSPILLDTRERFQINNQLISEEEYYGYLSEIAPVVEQVAASIYGGPTHFELLSALTYYIFYKKGVDYAVIETGLGGLFDGTNVVTNPSKIAVITRIGLDHMHILGKTLPAIAAQKAGIIHPGNVVVTLHQHPKVLSVIQTRVAQQKASLHVVEATHVDHVSLVPFPTFDFNYAGITIPHIQLRMLGSFQIQNCSLALTVLVLLSQRDGFVIDQTKIRAALQKGLFLGRMQQVKRNGQTLIIDGAHNPQKMRMLAKNLQAYFPHQQFVFIVALKRGKAYRDILRPLISLAKGIIVTPFRDKTAAQGFSVRAEDTKTLARIFADLNYKQYRICANSQEALALLQRDKKMVGVITGSLYLLSELYAQKDFLQEPV